MQEKVNSFTFFYNYYKALKILSIEDRNIMLNAILEYVFEDKEQQFEDTKELAWELIKPSLDLSKKNSRNATKPKRNEKETKKKRKENQKETKQKERPSISISYSNNNILNNLFKEYITLRNKKKYIVNDIVINRLISKLLKFDENEQKVMLENAINGAWKDLYEPKKEEVPKWFNEEIKKEERIMSEEERLEIESIINGTYGKETS